MTRTLREQHQSRSKLPTHVPGPDLTGRLIGNCLRVTGPVRVLLGVTGRRVVWHASRAGGGNVYGTHAELLAYAVAAG